MKYLVLKYEKPKFTKSVEVVDRLYFSSVEEVQEYIERHSNSKTDEGEFYYKDEYIINTFSVTPDN